MSCVGKDGGKGRCSALELGDGRASKKLKLRHDGSTVSACFAAEDRELVDIALGSPVEAKTRMARGAKTARGECDTIEI